MQAEDAYTKIFSNKDRVMAVFAHPDDAEIYCGGTIARLTNEDKRVRVVKLTSGNKGSRQEKLTEAELAKIRETEDAEGLRALGVKDEDNITLGISDGSVEDSLPIIGLLARQIRIFKPDLIITHNPENIIIRDAKDGNYVNHRDHRNTGMAAIDAAYPYSRDLPFFPERLIEKGVVSRTVTEFLFVDYWDHQDQVMIDVTSQLAIRTKAIACHSSQYSLEHAKESTAFFTNHPSGKGYEKLHYVIAD